MSSRLSRCLKSLESSGFLSSQNGNKLQLLEHGQAYANMLKKQWLDLRPLSVYMGSSIHTSTFNKRFLFLQSEQFSGHFKNLCQKYSRKAKCPVVLKHESLASSTTAIDSVFTYESCNTYLITDFLVQPQRGLEHFYNIQRESKIWWMRYSSNPSRYRIFPYEVTDDQNGQAIDIKASFDPDNEMTIEHLTLVIPNEEKFQLPHAKTGETVQPTVIRSSIPLEIATSTLLLDGCDHNRETQSLLLNRHLAPYQCVIAGLQGNPRQISDLTDLCHHLRHILQNSGLRLCQGDGFNLAKDQYQLSSHHQESDILGIPYTLVLNEKTLENGLLQLRSRDTKLEETIHISDIPDYLLNIFKN